METEADNRLKNYAKGKNVDEEWQKDKIPIDDLPEDFLWMQVAPGSKLKNLLEYALNHFVNVIVWSGSGAAIQKAISCAEIMKRKYNVQQITKLSYRRCEEHWNPLLEGLEPLVVVRNVPTIHIMLKKSDENPKTESVEKQFNKKKNQKKRTPLLTAKLKEFTGKN